MNKLVKLYARPKLDSPNMLTAWPGIGNVAIIVAAYLERKLAFKKLGEVEASHFFDPIGVVVKDNVVEAPQFPQNRFYYWKNKEGGSDIILFIGEDQPASKGYELANGASPIGNRLGQPVFGEKLWLWDDATIAYRPESRPCDDEGIPSQRTPLIQQGSVTNFLYDLQTAALAHTQSTANGSRNRGGLPTPSPSAFVIAPGKTSFNEMVNDIKEGLVIEQLMGATQGNILGGDFSGNVLLGYKVESGKIVKGLKGAKP